MLRSLPLAVPLATLVACTAPGGGSAETQVRPGAIAVDFRCGDRRVTTDFTGETMRLQLGGETIELRQAPSGSGARYEAPGDPKTWFWNKGRAASMMVKGRTYPECVQEDDAFKSFRARGNEPGWSLDLEPGRMVLVTNFGAKRVATPRPAAQRTDAYTRYAARTESADLTVTIFERNCRDDMTGMPHPYAVEVVHDGAKLAGCGGDPATLLQGWEWVVEDIDGKGLIDRSRGTLNFGPDGRVSGRSFCNSFTGQYKLTGEGLTVGKTAGTMMACPEAVMRQEALFLGVLRDVRRFDVGPDGALVLQTDDQRSITARR